MPILGSPPYLLRSEHCLLRSENIQKKKGAFSFVFFWLTYLECEESKGT